MTQSFPPHCPRWYIVESLILPTPIFQWVVASLIFQLPSESDTLNTPNTSFSTSHLFRSPLSPPRQPAMATSYQQRHTLHWFTSPTPNRHQNLPQFPILWSVFKDKSRWDQILHFLHVLCTDILNLHKRSPSAGTRKSRDVGTWWDMDKSISSGTLRL